MTGQEKLYKMVKDVLLKRNFEFEEIKDYKKRFVVKTKIGNWEVTPDKERYSKVWTIFTCWDNVKDIPQFLKDNYQVNTYSGKMNIHTMTIADTMWDFDYAAILLENNGYNIV